VRLEVCDQGERAAASDEVVRVVKLIFAELDADKEQMAQRVWRDTRHRVLDDVILGCDRYDSFSNRAFIKIGYRFHFSDKQAETSAF
jgi:hypothetical protein